MSCARSCAPCKDKDQSFIVHDFGPGGIVAPVSVKLFHGLHPGSIISAVVTTDVDMAINVRDGNNNILIHVVARVVNNDFALNSFLDGKWTEERKVRPIPTQQGCRFAAMLVYEATGYRVFVNGVEVAFYNHRSSAAAHLAEVNGGQVFKLVYLTMKDVVPVQCFVRNK